MRNRGRKTKGKKCEKQNQNKKQTKKKMKESKKNKKIEMTTEEER